MEPVTLGVGRVPSNRPSTGVLIAVGVVLVVTVAVPTWWLWPEEVTVLVLYHRPIEVTVYLDGEVIVNESASQPPDVGVPAQIQNTLTLTKGSHHITATENLLEVDGQGTFTVLGRLYVEVWLHEDWIQLHWTSSKPVYR